MGFAAVKFTIPVAITIKCNIDNVPPGKRITKNGVEKVEKIASS
jgi:hypothetical protein